MILFKTKYVMAITEAWIQEDYSCLCLPLFGTTLSTFPIENEGRAYNLIIPILFFDIVVIWGTKPITNTKWQM